MFYLSFIFVLLLPKSAFSENDVYKTRNLTTEFLPPGSKEPILAYTKAVGVADTLHYIYSSVRSPSILLTKTDNNATLFIDFDRFLSKNKSFQDRSLKVVNGTTFSSSILSFDTLYIYDDPRDEADMSLPNITMRAVPLRSLRWHLSFLNNTSHNSVQFISYQPLNKPSNKYITFEFEAGTGALENTKDLPHLLLNNNLTVIDVTFHDVNHNVTITRGDLEVPIETTNTSGLYSHPRIALQMVMMVNRKEFGESELLQERYIDDQLAPGSFVTSNWLSKGAGHNSSTADKHKEVFVQWRPISYTDPSKSLQALSLVKEYTVQHNNHSSALFPLSLASAYYGQEALDSFIEASFLNISFGVGKDRWYSKTNFTTWKLTYGLGAHPRNTFSLLIILLICLGLGIPAILLVGLAIYLPIKKICLSRRRGYEEIPSTYPQII